MSSLLTTTNVSKTYHAKAGNIAALRNVSLTVEAAEFVAIMGPSGCGKSTLLHLLGGLDRVTDGEIHLGGRRIDTLNETQLAKLRRSEIGYVFQFFNLIGNLSVADNIEIPALMAGHSAGEARRRRVELLNELGLEDKATTVPSRLSGGQQQRVALARALVNRPTLLLADEPTGNLDSQSASDVLSLLRRYHQHGQTIVIVTHNARVASAADRVITMRDGQIRNETRLDDTHGTQSVVSRLIALEA